MSEQVSTPPSLLRFRQGRDCIMRGRMLSVACQCGGVGKPQDTGERSGYVARAAEAAPSQGCANCGDTVRTGTACLLLL